MSKDSLGDRMKSYYEDRYRISTMRRTNVIIRIDGKAFHTYTKGLHRPFDTGLGYDMDQTAKYLCENIQGAKMGYVQSDEISILITDYDSQSTSAWFDNNIQKICSIASSMATARFNQLRLIRRIGNKVLEGGIDSLNKGEIERFKLAMFDTRIFVIPEAEEVVNYFIWRQQDATRNSISMAAQSMFSHKELQGKTGSQMQDMMMLEKNVNWNNYATRFKRGTAIIRETELWKRHKETRGPGDRIGVSDSYEGLMAKNAVELLGSQCAYDLYERSEWKIAEIPIFTQDREFILSRMRMKEKV